MTVGDVFVRYDLTDTNREPLPLKQMIYDACAEFHINFSR